MDFEKIAREALSKTVDSSIQDIFDNNNSPTSTIKDEELRSEFELIKNLQKFSMNMTIEALKIYHDDLKKELKKQGINI